jgi:hypothetical protein
MWCAIFGHHSYQAHSLLLQPGKYQEHTNHTDHLFFSSVMFLMRNCFAHFREVNNGHQAFGVNTVVRSSSQPCMYLHNVDFFLLRKKRCNMRHMSVSMKALEWNLH